MLLPETTATMHAMLHTLRAFLSHPVTAVRLLCSGVMFDAFIHPDIHPGSTVGNSNPAHRDYGDEDDFDVVCTPDSRGFKVNQTPGIPDFIEPVMAIRPDDRVTGILRRGVEIGDFTVAHDGSIEPVIPQPGEVNHTWVMVLAGEMMLAAGRDVEDPIVAALPRRIADLVRDLIEK